ncbi:MULTISPECIES: STY4851/ECs_5259 family protein [unclassified Oceanobacter]|uniref:STY4851/ECs_5259 family protein n=1 Tax=unclassified Oceanobacter TaxID=2620260 RepID=UPI0027331E41|nr:MULTISPECIES: STY4851/ECs_5259 family protein [unclassified Oceanobacter]MDP2609628.1 STY4851/ECs_5259 family protein [Oceanobacter sp. 1_MG-2023]MDP2612711.1 STY4851/ECs_5259 family protein [Oceanobacter sp. 2_MG-2023]
MTITPQIHIFSIHGWLSRLLTDRDLRTPDQRPLFKYQLTADEYSELLVQLRKAIGSDNAMTGSATCAAFCLFCAEWYRREYQVKDNWSWDAIWQRLGHEFSAQELARIVPKGLEQYWQRPIRFYESERRNFLGSLFSEGGLPFQVLTKPGSRFQALFTRVLKQYGASQALTGSLEPVVQSQIEHLRLPQAFREQTSVELIVNMADQLARLVGSYQLEQKSNPVEELDRSYPRWRESFPIPLDDDTGRGFLNGLLTTASKEARKTPASGDSLACEHFWQSGSECLETEITLPVELSMTVNQLPVSNRFDLSIHEGRTLLASVGPAYGTVKESRINVRVRRQNLVCRRKDPSKALSVVASIGGQAIGAVEISGSVLDLGVVPVGFDSSDESLRWHCVGQSSFTTHAQEMMLLVPKGSLVTSEDCSVSEQTLSVFGTRLWHVSGCGRVSCSKDDVYSIRLGGAQDFNPQIDLKGKLLDYSTRPSATYIGLPQMPCALDAPSEVTNARLLLNGTAAGVCHLNERLGTQWLTVKSSEGQTWLRRRVGILPADFQIELQPGDSPNHGYIRFKSSVNCFVEFASDHLKAQRLPDSGCITYELNSDLDIPPSQVVVRVCPNLESDPIEIQLPFPTVGVVALDADEHPLPKTLSVDDLLGTRLYLFARPDRSVQYRIEMRLTHRSSSHVGYEWSYRADPKWPVEVSLYELRSNIESLLSLEDGIDQKVLLTISGDGRDSEYRICRHAANLEKDWDRNVLYSSALASGDEKSIRPVLMLLNEPERRAQKIFPRRSEGVATGEFDIPDVVEKNGPWLVLPHQDSQVSFRPLFIGGSHVQPEPAEDIRSLQRAVLAFDHKSPISAFTPVFQQMALNPGHSGWQFFKSLYDQYNYLSLATFEVWKALVNYPDALAMSLYKFGFEAGYVQHLEKDFPTLWEAFPISVLKTASVRYWGWMVEQGIPVKSLDEHLKPDFATKLAACMPMLQGGPAKWLDDGSLPQEVHLPKTSMHSVIRTKWYQKLLRNHGNDDQWPHNFGKQLKRWVQSQPVDLLGFEPEQDYRNAVVYMPVYLAAVAAGIERLETLLPSRAEAAFHIRQTRDFDTDWFRSVYQYALLKFISISQKESQYQ